MGKRIPPCHLAPQARILSSTIVLVPYYRGDDILVGAWRKFSRDVASSSVRRASANGMAAPSQGTWSNQRATRPLVGSPVSAENPNPSAASVNMMKPRKASRTDSASSWAGVLVFLSGGWRSFRKSSSVSSLELWSGLSESNRHLNLGKVRVVNSNALERRHLAFWGRVLIGK